MSPPVRKELCDGKVRLRPYIPRDAAALFEAAKESVASVGRYLPWCHEDYTFEEAAQWCSVTEEKWENAEAYDFVIEDALTREFLGGCAINRIEPQYRRCNLGYWVRSSRQKRGFATAATRMLARWALEELGLRRVEISAAVTNAASCRVAEKAGAVRESIQRNGFFLGGKSVDGVVYSIIPSDLQLD